MGSDWTEGLAEILFENSFMTLATADRDGVPWVTPVEFVCDEDLRFYWMSVVDTRHSRNLQVNPRAAFTIYDAGQTPGVNAVQGLYGEGSVEVVEPGEVGEVRESIVRWIAWRDEGRATPRPAHEDSEDPALSPWRFYRIDPDRMYALDPVALEDDRLVDSRVPVDISDAFSRAYGSRLGSHGVHREAGGGARLQIGRGEDAG